MKGICLRDIWHSRKYFVLAVLICVVALSGCTFPPSPPSSDLRVQKSVTPSFATLGTNVVYKYNITNYNVDSTATGITLVDDRFGQIELDQDSLGPRDSMIVTLPHEVNQNDLQNLYRGVFIVNNATVTGTLSGEDYYWKNAAFVATPLRVIQKTASNEVTKLGDEITYHITVYSPGEYTMTNVTVKDTFDKPVDFVSANPMPSEGDDTWNFSSVEPNDPKTITLVVKPQDQETPYLLKNCVSITNVDDKTTEDYLAQGLQTCPDIMELLPYFHDCENVTVLSKEYSTMDSFEELLRDQHRLLVSFDELIGQTPVTREQKIEYLYSIEDLYRRQAVGMDEFSNWIDKNWEQLNPTEKIQITASLEDLLRRQAKNLDAFNGNLLAWVKTFDPVYRQKFSDSFEDLLHRQATLLKKFEAVLHQDGMQTPLFLSSFEDLLRRQAQSLEGFGDLGNFTFDPAPPLKGPGIAIYKTANKTSLSCDEEVTYKYTVYNTGDQEVTDIKVNDPNLPGGPFVGTIDLLEVYQSKSINQTITYGCSPNIVYPTKMCNTATAEGKDESGEVVEATSNQVCIILNGPSAQVKCEPIQGHKGQFITVRGAISKGVEGCIILTADDGSEYALSEKNGYPDVWAEVQSILATGGCAEISGCAYVGIKTTCQQGTPLYVTSCKEIECSGISCPIRSGNIGQDVTLTGKITQLVDGNCFVLTDNAGVKYELEMDDLYPDAWNNVRDIQQKGGCAEIEGCAYGTMPPICKSGSGTPVYVKSCKVVACPELKLGCMPMKDEQGQLINGVLATKIGPLGDPTSSCPYILDYSYQPSSGGPTETKKYWLTVDKTNSQYQGEYNKLLNHATGDYVKVYGCIYEGLKSPCQGLVPEAIPMYVRSVEVYPKCGDTTQVPFIARGTIVSQQSCMVFYSATGPLKFELKEDNSDAWNIIQNFNDTSKMVEIYGCLDNSVGACGFPSWHVEAAVPLVGAMVIKPGQNAPPKVVPSSRCETCFDS